MTTHQWHCIIPFFNGENKWVKHWEGAPISKKYEYLKKTIDSIKATCQDPDIHIVVCNNESAEVAQRIHTNIHSIKCHSKHLPYESIRYLLKNEGKRWGENDIVLFNEDDQELTISCTVKEDIETQGHSFFFSPHRWEKLFLLFYIRKKRLHRFKGDWGLIDNIEKIKFPTSTYTFNHVYRKQVTKIGAYAACWATYNKTLQNIPFPPPKQSASLEEASFFILKTKIPVLKLDIELEKEINSFMVNHLSGYINTRRLISFARMKHHLKKVITGN